MSDGLTHDQTTHRFPRRCRRIRLYGSSDEGGLCRSSRPSSREGAPRSQKTSTAADFAGLDIGAVWEDFMVGMESFTRWERVAVVTDVEWIKHAVGFSASLCQV